MNLLFRHNLLKFCLKDENLSEKKILNFESIQDSWNISAPVNLMQLHLNHWKKHN